MGEDGGDDGTEAARAGIARRGGRSGRWLCCWYCSRATRRRRRNRRSKGASVGVGREEVRGYLRQIRAEENGKACGVFIEVETERRAEGGDVPPSPEDGRIATHTFRAK